MYAESSRPASRFSAAENVPERPLTKSNVVALRIGLSWGVTGSAMNVVETSYAQHYWTVSTRNLTLAVYPNDASQWRRYRWTDLNGNAVWDAGEERALLGTRGGIATQDLDSNIEDTCTDQVMMWLERQLAEKLGVRAGFVWKRHSRRFTSCSVLTPLEVYTIPVQKLDRWADGRAGTSDDGQTRTPLNLDPALIGRTWTIFTNALDYPEEARNIGFVATRWFINRSSMSASHAVTWRNEYNGIPYNPNGASQSGYITMTFIKLSGSYEPAWQLRPTPLLRFESGTPYGRRAQISVKYRSQTVLLEPTGTARMEAPAVFDLRVERRFSLPRDTTMALVVDVFNITNSNAEVDIHPTSGSTYQWPISVLPPRVVRFGAKFS